MFSGLCLCSGESSVTFLFATETGESLDDVSVVVAVQAMPAITTSPDAAGKRLNTVITQENEVFSLCDRNTGLADSRTTAAHGQQNKPQHSSPIPSRSILWASPAPMRIYRISG